VEAFGGAAGPFEDLEVIRQDAAMPVSRFTALIGIPRHTYTRWIAKRAGRESAARAVAGASGRARGDGDVGGTWNWCSDRA
jgi:hypothetical protein